MIGRLVLLTLAIGGLFASASACAQNLSPDPQPFAQERLSVEVEGGERAGDFVVSATVEIGAPVRFVWQTLLDCERAKQIMREVIECRVLARADDGGWDVREHVIAWSWLLPRIRSVFRADYTPMTSIRFQKTGGDMRRLEGEWLLAPLRSGRSTLVRYRAIAGVEVPAPDFVVRAAIEADVPGAMRKLKAEAERLARTALD